VERLGTAEWGFAIDSTWGTGVFQEGADLMLDFAFETLGVHRLARGVRTAAQRRSSEAGAVQECRAQVVHEKRRANRPGPYAMLDTDCAARARVASRLRVH
jgi:hypothetical protein